MLLFNGPNPSGNGPTSIASPHDYGAENGDGGDDDTDYPPDAYDEGSSEPLLYEIYQPSDQEARAFSPDGRLSQLTQEIVCPLGKSYCWEVVDYNRGKGRFERAVKVAGKDSVVMTVVRLENPHSECVVNIFV